MISNIVAWIILLWAAGMALGVLYVCGKGIIAWCRDWIMYHRIMRMK